MQVNIHEAKTNFSRLVERAAGGEEIVIARAGTPVAKLVPLPPVHTRRVPGGSRGQIVIHDNFDDPLEEFEESIRRGIVPDEEES